MKRHFVLIVAGGRGSRMGSPLPKQYLDLCGAPVLRHTVQAFQKMNRISGICVVIHPDDQVLYEKAVEGLDLLSPVMGGAERQNSVRNGLEALVPYDPYSVLIHDGARPFISEETVDRVLDNIEENQGVVPAIAVADTLRRVQNNLCKATVDRSGLWRMQTPQGFLFSEILCLHRAFAQETLTDDASLFEKAQKQVKIVEGQEANYKITTQADLERARKDVKNMAYEFRTGQGFDVHRFCEGDHVMLCGVPVPHSHGLKGHSDADVALHALTDALLGAICAGDIGVHFPPTEARWKGASSDMFLKHALELVQKKGAMLCHLDLTLICERPKIGPQRDKMIQSLSDISGLAQDRISIKGTTTEKLGFTGRREGIAAQAVVTIRLPVPDE